MQHSNLNSICTRTFVALNPQIPRSYWTNPTRNPPPSSIVKYHALRHSPPHLPFGSSFHVSSSPLIFIVNFNFFNISSSSIPLSSSPCLLCSYFLRGCWLRYGYRAYHTTCFPSSASYYHLRNTTGPSSGHPVSGFYPPLHNQLYNPLLFNCYFLCG